MIKQNQTYLNRLHVVMDAVCIYFAGFAAWYIRFKCTIFGFWLNQEIFDLNRYYPEFYQYQKPLISSLILLLLLYSFFGLYTPKRYPVSYTHLLYLNKMLPFYTLFLFSFTLSNFLFYVNLFSLISFT